jgi:hypothetical protein
LKTRKRVFLYIQPGEGKLSVHKIFDLGVFNLSFIFYCKMMVLVLIFSTMDKLDKQWLVFEAFGVNFPWKDVKELSDEDLDYLYNKADEAKKRHEAAMEAQKQQQRQQMAAMQAAQQGGGGNIITPANQGYSFDQP